MSLYTDKHWMPVSKPKETGQEVVIIGGPFNYKKIIYSGEYIIIEDNLYKYIPHHDAVPRWANGKCYMLCDSIKRFNKTDLMDDINVLSSNEKYFDI